MMLRKNEIEQLRGEILAKLMKPKLTSERAELITKAYRKTEGDPAILRRAKALKTVLSEMTIYIQPHELIVGNLGPEPISAPVYPEGGVDYILNEMDTFGTRPGDKFIVPVEVKEKLREILPWWSGKTVKDLAISIMPEDSKKANDAGLICFENMLISGVGHFLPNYERVLKQGINGLEECIKARMSTLRSEDPEDFQKNIFYKSCLICCEAVKIYARRYAELARRLAENEKDGLRRKNLLQIARVLDHVPAEPARTFHEALQALWLIHVILHIDSNGYGVTLGRMDQYLYPYFRNDIKKHTLTKDEAKDLLVAFWIKCSELLKLYSNKGARLYAGFPVTDPPILGGLTLEGEDATNELSELMLEVEEEVRLPQPDLAVLWTNKMSDDFLLKAAKLVPKTNKPKFFNAHVGVRALIEAGILPKEAEENYAFVGCVENSISGKTWGWSNAGSLNLAKCLELALNNGIDPESNTRIGPATGNPTEFGSFTDLKNAFEKQIANGVRLLVQALHAVELAHRERWPEPLESILVDGCLESGREVNHGGALYNFTGIQAVGLATCADSLIAIKRLVFDERAISMEALLEALRNDFNGQETLRQRLLNEPPKFGNDIDEVDHLACEIVEHYCNQVKRYRNLRGGLFLPGTFSVSSHHALGEYVGATPDGRKAKAPLSDAHSPVQGQARSGPTAVLKSMVKQNHALVTNGTLLNMRFNVHTLTGEERLRNFAKLIKTYLSLGGFHVQFNIVDPRVLKEAQKHPERYPDLMVRVAAYVAPWNQLSKELQDEILSRTEFEAF